MKGSHKFWISVLGVLIIAITYFSIKGSQMDGHIYIQVASTIWLTIVCIYLVLDLFGGIIECIHSDKSVFIGPLGLIAYYLVRPMILKFNKFMDKHLTD